MVQLFTTSDKWWGCIWNSVNLSLHFVIALMLAAIFPPKGRNGMIVLDRFVQVHQYTIHVKNQKEEKVKGLIMRIPRYPELQ